MTEKGPYYSGWDGQHIVEVNFTEDYENGRPPSFSEKMRDEWRSYAEQEIARLDVPCAMRETTTGLVMAFCNKADAASLIEAVEDRTLERAQRYTDYYKRLLERYGGRSNPAPSFQTQSDGARPSDEYLERLRQRYSEPAPGND